MFWVVCMSIPLLVCWDFDFPNISGCAGRETITGTWQSSKQEMKEKKLLIIHLKHMRYTWNSYAYISSLHMCLIFFWGEIYECKRQKVVAC